MPTAFLQVTDNARTLAPASSLNNTTTPLTISGLDTRKFDPVVNGYLVTIWDDVTYQLPDDDPNMEKAMVTAATIAPSGSLTITRSSPKAHTGSPRVALLAIARHISDLENAVNAVETTVAGVIQDKNYQQVFTASASVSVNHSLGKLPAVTVIDTAGDECMGSVHHTDINNLIVTFSSATSGTVYCN